MFAIIAAAASGIVVGLRPTPLIWMLGGIIVFVICAAQAVWGWTWASTAEGLAGLIAFNVIALAVAAHGRARTSSTTADRKSRAKATAPLEVTVAECDHHEPVHDFDKSRR